MTHQLSEEELSAVFEKALQNGSWARHYPPIKHFARELTCQQGRPDFVASPVRIGLLGKAKRERLAQALYNPSTARMLSLAKWKSPRTEDYFLKASGFSLPVVRRSLAALEDWRYLEQTKTGSFILTPNFPALRWELWAFELKLGHWQRALYQALQYRAFAHRVAIVVPERWAHRVEAQVDRFRKLKVGVIVLDEQNSTMRFIVRPAKGQPASRFHHLYALGRFIGTMD